MPGTRRFRRDRMIAATVALVVNALIAWQLQDLLRPARAPVDEATEALQVVWIAARPPRDVALAVEPQRAATRSRNLRIPAAVGAPAPPKVSPDKPTVDP